MDASKSLIYDGIFKLSTGLNLFNTFKTFLNLGDHIVP